MSEENPHFASLHDIDAVLAAGFKIQLAQFKQNMFKLEFNDGTIVEYGIFTEFLMGKCLVTSEVMVNNIHIGSRPVGANTSKFYLFLHDFAQGQKESSEKDKQDLTFTWIEDLIATEEDTPIGDPNGPKSLPKSLGTVAAVQFGTGSIVAGFLLT